MTYDETIAAIAALEARLSRAHGAETKMQLRRQIDVLRTELLGYVPSSTDLTLSSDPPDLS